MSTPTVPAALAALRGVPPSPLDSPALHSFCTRPASAVYVIGLMSGTSLDGVDAVVAAFPSVSAQPAAAAPADCPTPPQPVRMLAHHFLPMPSDLRAQLLALNSPSTASELNGGGGELHQAALASNALSHLYARAVQQLLSKAGLRAEQVLALGNHGQTVRHVPTAPSSYTLQLGNHALLAELTGIPVIADFRSRDVAAGGTGAPLVPAFHQALFASGAASSSSGGASPSDVLVLNLGGIANVSWVRGDSSVLGFDTGPANVLADLWIQAQNFPDTTAWSPDAAAPAAASDLNADASVSAPSSTLQYDAGGAWGSTGRVIPELLDSLLSDPYFSLSPPKSTGRDLFSPSWLAAHGPERFVAQGHTAADVMATLVELTAVSVAQAIHNFCSDEPQATSDAAPTPVSDSASDSAAAAAALPSSTPVFVCGGGAHNALLLSRLSALMPTRRVQTTTQACGVGVECMEALAFAWLAWRFLHGQTANMPAVTGAKGGRILGAYYPA